MHSTTLMTLTTRGVVLHKMGGPTSAAAAAATPPVTSPRVMEPHLPLPRLRLLLAACGSVTASPSRPGAKCMSSCAGAAILPAAVPTRPDHTASCWSSGLFTSLETCQSGLLTVRVLGTVLEHDGPSAESRKPPDPYHGVHQPSDKQQLCSTSCLRW